MHTIRSFPAFAIVCSFLAASLPSGLAAAELEEIIVTAQKREQSLQDVSAAVTAVSMDRLQNAQIDNIEDLQFIVPSIYLGNDFNMAKLNIRGVGANTSTTGSEAGVAVHVDGVVVSRAEAQMLSFFDLERVEVLRGPQGSLYGRNAVGGSINLITAKPTEELEGYGRFTYGNYDYMNFDGAVGGPIMSDRLLGRVAFKWEDRDGFGENPVTGHDVDDLDRMMARAQLQFNATDDFDVLVSGEWYDQDDSSRALKFRREAFPGVARLVAGGCPVIAGVPQPCTFADDKRDLASESDPFTETDAWSITGTLNWRVNDELTLTNITSYRDYETVIAQDLDIAATLNSRVVPDPTLGVVTNFNTTVQRRDVDSEQVTTEFQFKYDNHDWFNGVLGFFYLDETQRPVDTVGLDAFLGQAGQLAVLGNPATGAFPPISATGLQIDGVNVPAVPVDPALATEACNTEEYLDVDPANPPEPKRVCIHSDLGTEAYALFSQVNMTWAQFTLTLGGRYSVEKRTSANPSVIIARNGVGPVLVGTTDGSYNERTFQDFSPEVGATWRVNDEAMFYYRYSKGFKSGAGENAAPGAPSNFVSIIVDPEKVHQHEFGSKSEWLDNRLAVNVAGFFYELQGQQINKTVSGGAAGFSTIFENAAETSAEGFEIEVFGTPTEQLRFSASLSYLHSRYDDFETIDPLVPQNITTGGPPPVACPAADNPITWPTSCAAIPGFVADPNAGTVQLAGNPTRNSPDWSWNLHGEYDFAGFDLPLGGMLTLQGDLSFKDDVYFTEFNRKLEGEDEYIMLDMALRYASGDGHWTGDLWVKNLTDEDVASSTFQLATARVIGVTYMPPRTFGFTLGYNF
jgi:iron complex outermembrane receptor protein